MKKSELKRLIKEVVEEVYSQQDEGIMDFLKDPTGKKRARAKAEKERGEKETRDNRRREENNKIFARNEKRLDAIIEGMRAGCAYYSREEDNVDTRIRRAQDDLRQAGGYEEHGIWEPNKRSQYGDRRGDDAVSAYDDDVSSLRAQKKEWQEKYKECQELTDRVRQIRNRTGYYISGKRSAKELDEDIKFLQRSEKIQTTIYLANRHKDMFYEDTKKKAEEGYKAYHELENYIT
jgi:hypothetical protein